MHSRFLALIAILGLSAPLTGIAQVYLTPEQVLQQNDSALLVPGGRRGAKSRTDFEAQLNKDRHPSIIREPWDPVVDTGLPPPVAITEPLPIVDSRRASYQDLDPLTARLLDQIEQQSRLLESQFANTGVPLAGTGPAAVLAVMAMGVATILTLRRARVLEKLVREF